MLQYCGKNIEAGDKMKKICGTEFTTKALIYLHSDINFFSNYTEEEKDALCGYIPMTEKLFKSCFKTAFEICDLETADYLIECFPEFTENSLK